MAERPGRRLRASGSRQPDRCLAVRGVDDDDRHRGSRRSAAEAAGWVRRAWMFVTLAPTSSIVPIATEVGAERRMYLPLAALIALVVAALAIAAGRLGPRRARYAFAAVCLLCMAPLTAATIARNREDHRRSGSPEPCSRGGRHRSRMRSSARSWPSLDSTRPRSPSYDRRPRLCAGAISPRRRTVQPGRR